MKNNQVIVVGSGIAGLVAAHHLKKNNIDPIILESSSRVGGRMVTDASDGYTMDGGAQFLSSAYRILSGLIKEFGIEAEFVETSRTVGIVRNGKIRKFRYDKPQSLLFGGLLSFKEWLSFGFGSFRLLKQTKNLPVNDYSKWKEFDDETTESWSNRYYGKSITDYFIEPLLGAFFFQSPSNTSRALPIAINAFAAHKAKTMTLIGGIGRLPKLLAEGLDVRTSTRVERLSIKENCIEVSTTTGELKADKVILAAPATVSKKLYNTEHSIENELLNIKYSSTVNIAFALKKKLAQATELGDVYGVWVPRKERTVIAAFTIENAKDYRRAVTGELIHVMLSGEAGKAMVGQHNEKIILTVLPELEQYLPGISNNILFTKVYSWTNAEPMSPVGRSKIIHNYRESITEKNRVILAGDYLGMPFTEGAAETGLWAAKTILSMA